ncbi:solute carrier family 13 member 5-like [Centruroides sculpturatus]|uniref:solute carrier family 13 member 5-like n=1 Tax=Centruroides sculpturatus TaxID=218467 RepID=UPI000C6CEE3F|nr:solute carrier family 13 member 5-like [Centruroides sculpturatus]
MASKTLRNILKLWKVILGFVLLFIIIPVALVSPDKKLRAGCVCILMAIFWMLEILPLPVTSLMPVVLLPIFGVVNTDELSRLYMKETIMMFIGGLTLAVAIEHCNLHKRVALKVLLVMNRGVHWLMLGFMLITMFLSMWISNTATTAMMVPIIEAIIEELKKKVNKYNAINLEDISVQNDKEVKTICTVSNSNIERINGDNENDKTFKRMRIALMLSICYAANCGGTGSLTGTGPNLVMKGMLEEKFPQSREITFATWMMYNVPGMLICVFLAWIYLTFVIMKYRGKDSDDQTITEAIRKKYLELGRITFHECAVLILFIILVILWLFRDPKFIPGWVELFDPTVEVDDATPAIAIAILLFLIPAKPKQLGRSPPLLDWKTAQLKLPWGIILLIGGGFAMAKGAETSHLDEWIGHQLTYFEYLPTEAIIALMCFITLFLTEITSNTAVATIVLPVMIQLAVFLKINPLFLMLPVTVSTSYAFLLPVATPPNAIVFDASKMKVTDMMKAGIAMNIICLVVQFTMINTLGKVMFNLDTFPAWAAAAVNNTELQMQNMTFFQT